MATPSPLRSARPSLTPLLDPLLSPVVGPVVGAVVGTGRRLLTWPVGSQQGSRRNAMLGANELRHRRREQQEVEEFLADLTSPPPHRGGVSSRTGCPKFSA